MKIWTNDSPPMIEPAGHFGGLKTTDIVPFEGRNFAVQLSITPPGAGGHSHHHETFDQVFYIVDGQLTFTVGDKTFELKTGQSVLLEPMEPHATINEGTTESTVLVITVDRGDEEAAKA